MASSLVPLLLFAPSVLLGAQDPIKSKTALGDVVKDVNMLDPGTSSTTPCTQPSNCPAGDADNDTIPDAWEDKLARKFAPQVRLPPQSKDWTRPANVDWYLARVHMRFENKGACNGDVQILGVGAVTQSNMWQQSRREKNMTWRGCRETGTLRHSSSSPRFFLQPPNDAVHAGAPQSDWRAYVHVKRSSAVSGGYDIQYWFFYPYNDSVASFNHEADWERITVTVDSAGDFREAVYGQHNYSTTYQANQLTFIDVTHPVVYSADGSHASYPKAGSFDIKDVPAFDDHTYDGGPVWNTQGTLVFVGEKDHPRAGQEFVRYGGRWGEIGETSHTTGPQGPSMQGSWNTR